MAVHFWNCVGKSALGTELARIFCAGIGPLQLGVVLVLFSFFFCFVLRRIYLKSSHRPVSPAFKAALVLK